MIFGYGIQRESGWCELFSVLKFATCRALSETARLQALTVTLKSGAFCTIRVVPRFIRPVLLKTHFFYLMRNQEQEASGHKMPIIMPTAGPEIPNS